MWYKTTTVKLIGFFKMFMTSHQLWSLARLAGQYGNCSQWTSGASQVRHPGSRVNPLFLSMRMHSLEHTYWRWLRPPLVCCHWWQQGVRILPRPCHDPIHVATYEMYGRGRHIGPGLQLLSLRSKGKCWFGEEVRNLEPVLFGKEEEN